SASGCGPVVMASYYEPCSNSCCSSSDSCLSSCPSAPAPSKSATDNKASNWNSKKSEPEAIRRTAPRAPLRTFEPPTERDNATDDGLGTGGRSRGLRSGEDNSNSTDSLKPAKDETESITPKPKKPPVSDRFEEEFDKPIQLKKDGSGEAKIRLPVPTMNLDTKIAWRGETLRTRIPFHVKVTKACVARRVPSLDADGPPVVALRSGPQLVKK
ncbi:MAG TPA: hypothetical protein VK137_15025, partial [Planctomycetaceae bacterium]|nr:hypothetical protein [Planctomycetaceae bacterium]